MNNNVIINSIVAVIPITWLLISLGKLKMPAYKATLIAFLITVVTAFFHYKMPAINVAQASLEGIMLALFPILWVIIAALFVYNTTLVTGSMQNIKIMLSNLSSDRRIQGLIIAFAFGGFLEAVAGFGTAVAIPAGILVAMGFDAVLAATVCLIANTVPVAFGVLGVPIITLSQVTSLSLTKLTLYTALQLVPFAIFLPLILVFTITGSVRKMKGVLLVSISAGIVFAIAQTLTAIFVGAELAAVVGSLSSLIVIILLIKMFPTQKSWRFEGEKPETGHAEENMRFIDGVRAWMPYILILVIIFAIKFIPALDFLNKYPFLLKKQFYYGAGGNPMSFQLATSGGTILFVAAILGGLLQGTSVKSLFSIFLKTLKQIQKTTITVVAIVALAKVMGYSGMVDSIAVAIANASGRFYPFIAPLIGALGTFITGSDTSSNVLFGGLQKKTALSLGMNPEWLSSANAAGATVGKMISPQSIAIVSSATDLTNNEGKLLGKTIKYCIGLIFAMGIIVFIFSGSIK